MIHSPTEQKIAARVVADLLAADYAVSVDNGAAVELRRSRDPEAIAKVLAETGTDWLHAHGPDGKRAGWVCLVYGNGMDLVSDYSTGLHETLAATRALAARLDR